MAITKRGRPVAKLVPHRTASSHDATDLELAHRPYGTLAGFDRKITTAALAAHLANSAPTQLQPQTRANRIMYT